MLLDPSALGLWRHRHIDRRVEQVGLRRQTFGACTKACSIELCDLMLKDLQLLPQRADMAILLERERAQRIELPRQIVNGDSGRWHVGMMPNSSQVYKTENAQSAHARHTDGVMRFARRNLDAFKPRVQFGHGKAALGQQGWRRKTAVFQPLVP